MNLMKIRLDPRAWARFGQRKSLRSPISVGTSLPRKTRKKKPPRNLSKEGIEVKSSPTVIRDLSCFRCKHFDLESPDYVGAAFARGIPKLIMRLKNDHTIPYPGDNVIEFETLGALSADDRTSQRPAECAGWVSCPASW